eukprot:2897776-Karenia_brevis.AAC.1
MDMSEDMDMAAAGAEPRRDQFQRSDVDVQAADMAMSGDMDMATEGAEPQHDEFQCSDVDVRTARPAIVGSLRDQLQRSYYAAGGPMAVWPPGHSSWRSSSSWAWRDIFGGGHRVG